MEQTVFPEEAKSVAMFNIWAELHRLIKQSFTFEVDNHQMNVEHTW